MAVKLLLVYFRLGWIYLLHVVFSGLLLAKLTDETSWNWFIVFVPVYVFDAAAVVYWITYLVTYIQLKYEDRLDDGDIIDVLCMPNYNEHRNTPTCFPKQSISIIVLLMYAAGILLKVVCEVLLCLALNGTISFIVPGSAYSVLLFVGGLSFLYFSLKPMVYDSLLVSVNGHT